MKHTIICDTREKENFVWAFRASEWLAGTVRQKLDTGDYALRGLEHVCVVDRKMTVSELSGNLFQARFYRELERMKEIALPVIVCEFSYAMLEMFPAGSDLPARLKKRLRVTGSLLVKKLCEAQLKYPHVHWVFAGNAESARVYTRSLLKRVGELHEPPAADVAI